MTVRPIGEDELAVILEEINNDVPWSAVASRHGLPVSEIARLVRDHAPHLNPAPDFNISPPPTPVARPATSPSAVAVASGPYSPPRGEENPPFDLGDDANRGGRGSSSRRSNRESHVPDAVFAPGVDPRRTATKRYDAAARTQLLDRTLDAYDQVLTERMEEGGLSAKELLMLAEVYKLLDNQARLGEGEATERHEVSDNRDRVRESIRILRERRSGGGTVVPIRQDA